MSGEGFSSPHDFDSREDAPTKTGVLRHTLALARAFLLLGDPTVSSPHGFDEDSAHPHRAPLRSRIGTRRPGAGVPRAQHCVSPVARTRATSQSATGAAPAGR